MSKISNSIKKKPNTDSLSNFSRINTIKKTSINNDLFKDISEIKPNDIFYCNQDIKNSIFNEKIKEIERNNSIFNITQLNSYVTEKALSDDQSDHYFQVIHFL